jgi:hypothetical protein
MSISPINSVARTAASTAEPPAAVTQREAAAASSEQLDAFTQQPLPPRFPWLSRLALQLEAASRQRSAFATAPPLGDHVDKSV